MRHFIIAFILLSGLALIVWCRAGTNLGHIARMLPFSGGYKPGIYDVAAVVVIVLCILGVCRIKRNRDHSDFR